VIVVFFPPLYTYFPLLFPFPFLSLKSSSSDLRFGIEPSAFPFPSLSGSVGGIPPRLFSSEEVFLPPITRPLALGGVTTDSVMPSPLIFPPSCLYLLKIPFPIVIPGKCISTIVFQISRGPFISFFHFFSFARVISRILPVRQLILRFVSLVAQHISNPPAHRPARYNRPSSPLLTPSLPPSGLDREWTGSPSFPELAYI